MRAEGTTTYIYTSQIHTANNNDPYRKHLPDKVMDKANYRMRTRLRHIYDTVHPYKQYSYVHVEIGCAPRKASTCQPFNNTHRREALSHANSEQQHRSIAAVGAA